MKKKAFTIVELLVVIGIIALLISLLLPALKKARLSANSVACLANLRSIGQAMQMYVSANKGYIPGSANTSSRHIWRDSGAGVVAATGVTDSAVPEVLDLYDWISPLARTMGLKIPNTTSTVARYQYIREMPQFICPNYRGVVSTQFGTTPACPAGPAISYVTATAFMLSPFKGSGYSGLSCLPGSPATGPYWVAPAGYIPRINKIGRSVEKIFVADGAKWSDGSAPPTFSIIAIGNHNNNNWSDWGGWTGATKSFIRKFSNGISSTFDPRLLSFRHGSQRGFGRDGGSYRVNAVFFDGHAENLTEMLACNPTYWLPKGTVINNPNYSIAAGQPQVYADVAAKYKIVAGTVIP